MRNHSKKIVGFRFYISLLFLIFLPGIGARPVNAAEIILNSALSVTVPATQAGNPGDFVTYVLELSNRGPVSINLQVDYLSDRQWTVLGDTSISIPAHSAKQYYPVTIFIPAGAPAGIEEQVRIRFKISGETFPLPEVLVPVRVNSVSTINFTVPPSGKGALGTTVPYHITISNSGNTVEQVTVKYRSSNAFKISVLPELFELNPGSSQVILVEHHIPGNTILSSDQIELTFSWGNEQKIVTLTTLILDQLDELKDQFYIWKGSLNLSQAIGDSNYYFSLNGDWGPERSADFFFTKSNWFSDIQYESWDVKLGEFFLAWPGLVTPTGSGPANLYLSKKLPKDRYVSLYRFRYVSENGSGRDLLGAEARYNPNNTFRLLHDPAPSQETSINAADIVEWRYQTQYQNSYDWSNTFSANLADFDGLAGSFQLFSRNKAWNWSANYLYQQNLYDVLDKQAFQLYFYKIKEKPDALTGSFTLNYETRNLDEHADGINLYDDYRLEAVLLWPSNLRFNVNYTYHNRNQSFNGESLTYGLGSAWKNNRYSHEWWAVHTSDRGQDWLGSETISSAEYSRFDWWTLYQYSDHEDLIFNPQLDTDDFKVGLGYRRRWDFGPVLSNLWYLFPNAGSKLEWQADLEWPIYQYYLLFRYSGIWDDGSYTNSTCSLSVTKKFAFPIKKPLGTIEGLAFLDKNHNGIRDAGENPIPNLGLLVDGKTAFQTDAEGKFRLNGLSPGEHLLMVDSQYVMVYIPAFPANKFDLKPYQTLNVDFPVARTQNITGVVYRDRNTNQRQEPDEFGLAAVPLLLKDLSSPDESIRTHTNADGFFAFYQLKPGRYLLTADKQNLPENWQLPADFKDLEIDATHLEDLMPFTIGMVPFEKPVEIITLSDSQLIMSVDQELAYTGQAITITIDSRSRLRRLRLALPDGSLISLNAAAPESSWSHRWTIPAKAPVGEAKIICVAESLTGEAIQEELTIFILNR